jgi:hypothetical protein
MPLDQSQNPGYSTAIWGKMDLAQGAIEHVQAAPSSGQRRGLQASRGVDLSCRRQAGEGARGAAGA